MLFLQITRSVSNISSTMRRETSTARAVASEVATERSCYGVFRKLEPDDDRSGGGGSGGSDGGSGSSGHRAGGVVGEPRRRVVTTDTPSSPVPPPPSFSPQELANAYGTVDGVEVSCGNDDIDDDDYGDRAATYTVYCCGGDTTPVTTVDSRTTSATTATTTTGVASAPGGCCHLNDYDRDDYALTFDIPVWDDGVRGHAAVPTTVVSIKNFATDITGGDLRVSGGAAAPFSHTPMGSTTKLVGIDANSDDTPKVRCILSYIFF